jgi:hypothetical protein
VLIHAGDFMACGDTPREIVDFNQWLGIRPHLQRIVIGDDASTRYAIRIQNIRHGHDALQLVKIRQADDGTAPGLKCPKGPGNFVSDERGYLRALCLLSELNGSILRDVSGVAIRAGCPCRAS